MEATLMLTGITVGGALVFPLIMDYVKQHVNLLGGAAAVLLVMYLVSPYSPEVRTLWKPISELPDLFASAVYTATDEAGRLASDYASAVHRH